MVATPASVSLPWASPWTVAVSSFSVGLFSRRSVAGLGGWSSLCGWTSGHCLWLVAPLHGKLWQQGGLHNLLRSPGRDRANRWKQTTTETCTFTTDAQSFQPRYHQGKSTVWECSRLWDTNSSLWLGHSLYGAIIYTYICILVMLLGNLSHYVDLWGL